jgi:hypothetical protein
LVEAQLSAFGGIWIDIVEMIEIGRIFWLAKNRYGRRRLSGEGACRGEKRESDGEKDTLRGKQARVCPQLGLFRSFYRHPRESGDPW